MTPIISDALTVVNSYPLIYGIAALADICRMKTCDEIRRENLRTLIAEAGGALRLAERYDCSEAYIKQLDKAYTDSKTKRPREIGSDAARRLEKCMGRARGWMDNDHARVVSYADDNVVSFRTAAEPAGQAYCCGITEIAARMAPEGRAVLLYEARKIAEAFPLAKANPAS